MDERRVHRPLVPPHTWTITTLVSGTTVMLGVTGILDKPVQDTHGSPNCPRTGDR